MIRLYENLHAHNMYWVPEVPEVSLKMLFADRTCFIHVDRIHSRPRSFEKQVREIQYPQLCELPKVQLGQKAGAIVSYTIEGLANIKKIAADIAEIPIDIFGQMTLQQQLIAREHVFTLPVIEHMVSKQNKGIDFGLCPYRKRATGKGLVQSSNVFFTETMPGVVELVWLRRHGQKKWSIGRFLLDCGDRETKYALPSRLLVRESASCKGESYI